MAGINQDFKEGDDVFYQDKKTQINYINEDGTCQIDNPYWSWEEEATYVDADEDYDVPYTITVNLSELRPYS